jgi:hypothetical protein
MMKRLCFLFVSVMLTMNMGAQDQQKFSPEKFDAELQEFITNEAKLTPQEAAKFFPIYMEMQNKQRALFEKQRNLVMMHPQDESSCLKAIRERDEVELEMKRNQKNYHKRFLEIMPASKLYQVLNAEDRFHRRLLRRFNGQQAMQGMQNMQMPQTGNRHRQNNQPRWPYQQQQQRGSGQNQK